MVSPAHQPDRFRFSFRELAALPTRLCSPPEPSIGKVRSFGVTPLYQIKLEDVLDRKHLPPLGLKDFEEWLLFVEQAPENLYFVLWLREYTARYNQWISQSRADRNKGRKMWAEYNGQLAIFFSRARQTFFAPNSEFALALSYDNITTFHTVASPHPDPAIFNEVAIEAHNALQDSLSRFVLAAYSNVGTRRAICGIIAGTFVMLIGSVIPLATTIMLTHSRWTRISALPATWLGLTILFASLNGVCLSVYVFGDVRQLRKFELNPVTPKQRKPKPTPLPPAPFKERDSVNVPKPAEITIAQPPPTQPSLPPVDCFSDDESSDGDSDSLDERSAPGSIQISPEYYDDDLVEGPATSPMTDIHPFDFPPRYDDGIRRNYHTFLGTATFIHPYSSQYEEVASSDDDLPREDVLFGYKLSPSNKHLPEDCQPISCFNFDELPMRSESSLSDTLESVDMPMMPAPVVTVGQPEPSINFSVNTGETSQSATNAFEPVKAKVSLAPKHVLSNVQNNCVNQKKRQAEKLARKEKMRPVESPEQSKARVQKNFTLARAVPAFASPLTRVLSPIVKRAQWEVVVRSSAYALLTALILIGSLLAVPVRP